MATPAPPPPPAPAPSTICSICLEDVSANCGKTVVTLQCSDVFHLDCIGSAFNAKGSMQCPNCQAVENGVWRQFENERLPPAENVMMNVDTNDDEDLIAMGPSVLTSPVHGLIVQQPSSGNTNLASSANFNSDPPVVPGNELGSLAVDNQWNGLPVLTDPCSYQIGTSQCGLFHDHDYISTMCGHITNRDHQTLLLPAIPILDHHTIPVLEPTANFFQTPDDHPNGHLNNGFGYENMLNNPFSFAYESEDGIENNGPIISDDGAEQVYLLNSSPSSEMLDSIVAGMGSDQANTFNATGSSVGLDDDSVYSNGWNDHNFMISFSDGDDIDSE